MRPAPRRHAIRVAFALSLLSHETLFAQRPVSLAIGGRENANPSIAARGAFVAVTWSGATATSMDVFAALSRDGGATFGAPVRVNAVPGAARVNSELPPRIVLVPATGRTTPDLVVVWTARTDAGTQLLVARSTDGGRTFGAAKPVPGSTAAGSRGWQSVAVDSTGRVFVLWLDHRDAVAAGTMHQHDSTKPSTPPAATSRGAPAADPTERAQLSKLYVASLSGTGARAITGGVCYCCKTSLVAAGTSVYGVWRHVYAGSHRDIAFTMSRDGGRTFSAPVRVSEDGWQLDGCPENGPALAVDRARRMHVAWPAPPGGKPDTPFSLFYATSADGRRFTTRTQLPTRGPAAHVQMAIASDGQPLVAWDEVIDGARHLALARGRVDPTGKATFTRIDAPVTAANQGWPVLATSASGVVIAWVNGSGVGNALGVARIR